MGGDSKKKIKNLYQMLLGNWKKKCLGKLEGKFQDKNIFQEFLNA